MKQTEKNITCLLLFLAIVFTVVGKDIRVDANWEKTEFSLTSAHWSVNDYEILTPSRATQGFVNYAQQLSPAFIRIHQASIADTWTDEKTRTWNYARIKASFDSVKTAYGNARIFFNPICSWPQWLSDSHNLTKEQENEIVRLFAEIAGNVKLHPEFNITHWEIFNEGEEFWENNNRLTEHWELFNRIAKEIKSILPDAKIGGPAFTWAKPAWVTSFLDCCGKNIDFISWHNYASGDPENLTGQILTEGVDAIVRHAEYIHSECNRRGLNDIDFFLTEYNVQWTWTPFEVRHATNEGALFQALVIKRTAPLTNGIFVWHLKGHSYGLIDDNDKIRSTGRLYLWGKDYLTGEVKKASSSHPHIEVLAVQRDNKKRAVLVMNTSPLSLLLPSSSMKIGYRSQAVKQINSTSRDEIRLPENAKEYMLPAYSLTIFIE